MSVYDPENWYMKKNVENTIIRREHRAPRAA
jgi:hypothetical protein